MSGILGAKLRGEREALGLTQEALSRAVGLSSEFISLLELGKRMPSVDSLTALANYFKKDASYFLKEKEEAFAMLFSGEGIDKKAREALKKFKKHCEEYLNLEELTGRRIDLAPLYTHSSAERMAEEERHRLGIGNEPVRDVFSLIELNGLHLIRQPIPEISKISGVFIYLETERAAFTLVNSVQSSAQQAFIAAHEYCHYLKDRKAGPVIDNPDVFIDEFVSLYHPHEIFAQIFASHFLIPPSKVKEIIDKDLSSKKLSFPDALYLKLYFGVSTLDMLQALKNYGYLSLYKFEEYRKLGPTAYEEDFLGETALEEKQTKKRRRTVPSRRFLSLALEAFRKKMITIEKLSELLGVSKDRIKSAFKTK
jgi:transcriptional regulator with XRE-family HTH domain